MSTRSLDARLPGVGKGAPPSGVVSFLAVEGLTPATAETHAAANDGALLPRQGAGPAVCVFARPSDAGRAASAMHREDPTSRIVIATGEARLEEGRYRSEALEECQRLCRTASTGQVVLSPATARLLPDEVR